MHSTGINLLISQTVNDATGEAGLKVRRLLRALTLAVTVSSLYAQLSIGTPPQNLLVEVDTGSSYLRIYDAKCGNSCAGGQRFDPLASSTWQASSASSQLQDALSSQLQDALGKVEGHLAADTVQLAGYAEQSQTFAVIDNPETRADAAPGQSHSRCKLYRLPLIFLSLPTQAPEY